MPPPPPLTIVPARDPTRLTIMPACDPTRLTVMPTRDPTRLTITPTHDPSRLTVMPARDPTRLTVMLTLDESYPQAARRRGAVRDQAAPAEAVGAREHHRVVQRVKADGALVVLRGAHGSWVGQQPVKGQARGCAGWPGGQLVVRCIAHFPRLLRLAALGDVRGLYRATNIYT